MAGTGAVPTTRIEPDGLCHSTGYLAKGSRIGGPHPYVVWRQLLPSRLALQLFLVTLITLSWTRCFTNLGKYSLQDCKSSPNRSGGYRCVIRRLGSIAKTELSIATLLTIASTVLILMILPPVSVV